MLQPYLTLIRSTEWKQHYGGQTSLEPLTFHPANPNRKTHSLHVSHILKAAVISRCHSTHTGQNRFFTGNNILLNFWTLKVKRPHSDMNARGSFQYLSIPFTHSLGLGVSSSCETWGTRYTMTYLLWLYSNKLTPHTAKCTQSCCLCFASD